MLSFNGWFKNINWNWTDETECVNFYIAFFHLMIDIDETVF